MRFELYLLDVGHLHVGQQLIISPHHLVRDAHHFAVHLQWRLVDADGVAQRLRHFLYAVQAFENRRGQHHLRFMAVGTLQFAANEQVKCLIGAAEFYVGFECDGVVALDKRVEQFVYQDRFLVLKSFVEVFAFEKLRDGILRHQANELIGGELAHPSAVEVDHGFLRIENFEDLCLIGFGIFFDLFAGERRARDRAARWIADHAGEIADQKNRGVAEVLKVLELAQDYGVTQVQVRSSRIHAEFHAQRLASRTRLLKLGAEVGLADDFRRAFLEVRQLFIDRYEGWHGKNIIRNREAKAECEG